MNAESKTASGGAALMLAVLLGGACGGETVEPAGLSDAGPPFASTDVDVDRGIASVASLSPRLRPLLAPRADGLEPVAGSFVTRALGASEPVPSHMGASFPALANRPIRLSPGRAESWSLRLHPIGAAPVEGRSDRGRVLFRDAYPDTDLIATATQRSAEWLLVLKSREAPREFVWSMELGADLRPADQRGADGSFDFVDGNGDPALRVHPAFAVDAGGREREVELAFEHGGLVVRADTEGLEFPVIVDPLVSVPVWTQRGTGPWAGRDHASLAYVPGTGVIMIGGTTNYFAGVMNHDAWSWNGNAWTNMGDPLWADFAGAPATTWKDQLVLFGGCNGAQCAQNALVSSTPAAVLYNPAGFWDVFCGGPLATCGISARSLHSTAVANGQLLIFGGGVKTPAETLMKEGATDFADLYILESTDTTNTFVQAFPTGPRPSKRRQAAMAGDEDHDLVLLFGGTNLATSLDDTWIWRKTGPHAGTWECVCNCFGDTGPRLCDVEPPARLEGGLAYDPARKRFVLFAGFVNLAGGSSSFDDTWEFDPVTKKWSFLCGAAFGVPCGAGLLNDSPPLVFDPSRQRIFQAAGYSSGYRNQYFELYVRGNSCAAATDCDAAASGVARCTNGACCDVADCGTCKSCADPQGNGNPGVCENIPQNQPDPAHSCTACDGNGACKGAPGAACSSGATCASGFCVNSVCCSTSSCSSGFTCAPSGTCKKALGQACLAGSECANGFCVDGFCCGTASCPAGSKCSYGGGSCKKDNGRSCAAGTECGTGNCVESFCCNSACGGACDTCASGGAQGTCIPLSAGGTPQGAGCGLYLCNGASAGCPTTCSSDSACTAAAYCDLVSGTCKADKGAGAVCATGGECVSGNCADSVCCNSACMGSCQACSAGKTGGANGTCASISTGTDPDNECPTDAASTCGRDGMCNGAGACRQYASGTSCATPSCTSGVATTSACNGTGTCSAMNTPCGGFVCNGAACYASCTNNAQCASTHYCRASDASCQPKLAQGAACTSGPQCTTGNCVDTVCCDSPCTGNCQACSAAKKGTAAGTNGVCGPVKLDTDPDSECAAEASTTCGRTGNCDGAGVCKLWPQNTPCGMTTCVPNAQTGGTQSGFTCNGLGACDTGTTTCGPYVCQGTSCGTSCATHADCVGSHHCVAGSCAIDLDNGGACTSALQCKSGFCTDGVCCDQACTEDCRACSDAKKGTTGKSGVCGSAADGTDPDDDCETQTPSECDQDGECNGQGQCRKYALGTVCGPNLCGGPASSTLTGQQCDGFGGCVPGVVECAPYKCGNGACLTACLADAECVSTHYCDTGVCQVRLENGGACASPSQCKSGFCAEGLCCDTACDGTCQSCAAANKESGADGACGNTKAGLDPNNKCEDKGPSNCDEDGFCNGQGGCRVYAAGSKCGNTECVDNTQTGFACDGFGACLDGQKVDCGGYACAITSGQCLTTCAADADCASSAFCDGSAGTCLPKDTDGTACSDASTCEHGFCVDGVCCDRACDAQCEACDIEAAKGTCSPVTGAPHGTCAECPAATETEPCSARTCDGQKSTASCVGYVGIEVACRDQSCANDVESFSATCNGQGQCGATTDALQSRLCYPFVCGAGSCKSSCSTDDDCAEGNVCRGNSCVSGATCKDDSVTIVSPNGDERSCAPFLCVAGACQGFCSSTNDCARGYVCDVSQTPGVCIAPGLGAAQADEGGCGCRVPKRSPPARVALALALLVVAAGRRRRRTRGAAHRPT